MRSALVERSAELHDNWSWPLLGVDLLEKYHIWLSVNNLQRVTGLLQ